MREYTRKFLVYDKNKDGFISAQEIKDVTSKLGLDMSPEEVATLIFQADKNKDGKVDYHEYVNMMMHKDRYLTPEIETTEEVVGIVNNALIIIDDP